MDTFGLYPNGNKVTEKPEILFARMDAEKLGEIAGFNKLKEEEKAADNAAEEKIQKTSGASDVTGADAAECKPLSHKPNVTFDDFARLEFRVGEVIACEEVPKSKKLLKETIRLGSEIRTVVSGIKKWYRPEDMVGKKVMVVCNLEPRRIAGELSQGMIVAAESEDGEMVSLMTPDNTGIGSGSEIG